MCLTSALCQFWACRIGKAPILVITESERTAHNLNLNAVPTLVLLNFPSSLGRYKEAVKSVCRSVVRGRCVAYFLQDEAELAPQLVDFLEACGQTVDSKLAMIAKAVEQVRGQNANIEKKQGVNGGRVKRQRL